jgi:hypothetical protein
MSFRFVAADLVLLLLEAPLRLLDKRGLLAFALSRTLEKEPMTFVIGLLLYLKRIRFVK